MLVVDNLLSTSITSPISVFLAYVNDDGTIVGEYKNCTFTNVTYAEKGGKFTATYNIRQYSDMEVRLNALKKEQTLQGDAIASMSETVYS